MEQSADLRVFIFGMLKKWRIILAFGLAVALVLGGYKLYTGSRQQDNVPSGDVEQQVEQLERSLKGIEAQIKSRNEYLSGSVYMKIDPYNIKSARLSFIIEAQEVEYDAAMSVRQTAKDMYGMLLLDEEFYDFINKRLDKPMAIEYIAELISIESGETGIINVRCVASDEALAKKFMAATEEYINSQTPKVIKEAGQHRLIMSSLTSKAIDDNMAADQDAKWKSLTQLRLKLKDVEKALAEAERDEQAERAPGMSSIIIYAVMGFIAGALLAVVMLLFTDAMSIKVRDERQLSNKFGLKLLGVIDFERGGGEHNGKRD
ncbi:MAG: hypothetical protein ACOYJD_08440 [Christensenellales bacterium]|jgi:capsular polysaccharide biosynthesis protein